MRLAKFGFAAVLLAVATVPALAADLGPVRGPAVVYARPRVYAAPRVYPVPYVWVKPVGEPRFVVNQGPEYSGPDIIISHLKMVNTDLRRSYPFIGNPKPRLSLIAFANPVATRVHRVEHVHADAHAHARVAVAHERRPLRIGTVHHHKRVVRDHKQVVHAQAKVAPHTAKTPPTPTPKPNKQKPD